MREEEYIENLRKELFAEVFLMESKEYSKAFERKFFRLFEQCIFLMLESDDNFFASILIQLKRAISFELSYAMASVPCGQYFMLYINPAIFLDCSYKEMQALIKHEVYHIITKHHLRAPAIKNMYSPLAINLAMDISINQYIINLPSWSETLEKVMRSYNVHLYEERSMEEYADEIQKSLNKLQKQDKNKEADKNDMIISSPDINAAHNLWENSEEKLDKQQIEEVIKKIMDNAHKGKAPTSVNDIISKFYMKPEIFWKDYLKKLMGTVPYGYKKTVTRKDRRQPNRTDLRGRLTAHTAEIIVAIDISGSVTDKEIDQIMSEVFSIVKNYNSKITIIECDNEIRRVYSVTNKGGIKKKVDTRGGTKFSPVFKYLKEKNMRNGVLIYFTDGLGEAELTANPMNIRVLWVLTGRGEKLSLVNPYGKILRISNSKPVERDNKNEFMKNELKDTLIEWAK